MRKKKFGKGDEVFDSAKLILGAGHSNESHDIELKKSACRKKFNFSKTGHCTVRSNKLNDQ